MTEINLRWADETDAAACLRFDRQVPVPVLRYKLQMQEILLAEDGTQPVGYLRLDYLWGHVPLIGLITVQKGRRGGGIGRAMLAALEEALRSQGRPCLYSSSQLNEPEPQRWHRRMGFEECGIITGVNVGGVGEVFFRKQLQSGAQALQFADAAGYPVRNTANSACAERKLV